MTNPKDDLTVDEIERSRSTIRNGWRNVFERYKLDLIFDAALRGLNADWQPIETAPIGTIILAIRAGETTPSVVANRLEADGDDWVEIGQFGRDWRFKPTHWQPLPPPPTEREEDNGRASNVAPLPAPAGGFPSAYTAVPTITSNCTWPSPNTDTAVPTPQGEIGELVARAKDPFVLGLCSTVIEEIAAERKRQIEVEGWTPEHDDRRGDGSLARAAAAYAHASTKIHPHQARQSTVISKLWPFDWLWFKPKNSRRNLVIAGALIVAEIERLDRAAAKETAP